MKGPKNLMTLNKMLGKDLVSYSSKTEEGRKFLEEATNWVGENMSNILYDNPRVKPQCQVSFSEDIMDEENCLSIGIMDVTFKPKRYTKFHFLELRSKDQGELLYYKNGLVYMDNHIDPLKLIRFEIK